MIARLIIRVGNIYFDNDTALLGLSNGILTLSGDLDMSDNSIENVKYIRFETLKEDYYTDLLNHDPSYIYLHTVRDQYTTALAISTSDIGIYGRKEISGYEFQSINFIHNIENIDHHLYRYLGHNIMP